MRTLKFHFLFSVPTLIFSVCLLSITGCVDKSHAGSGTSPSIYESSSSINASPEVEYYYRQITEAIQREFHDVDLYKGRTCSMRISILRDGTLVDVRAFDGDPELCEAAIIAIKKAKIPKPPSEDIFVIFKDSPVLFAI